MVHHVLLYKPFVPYKDFTPETQKYGDVHLFFISHISETIMDKIRSNPTLVSRIKTLKEVNLRFLAIESGCFSLDQHESMFSLYAPDTANRDQALIQIAEKLVTVCATLKEYPYIRYPQGNVLMERLAKIFRNQMDQFINRNATFTHHGQTSGQAHKRGTLLLLDRQTDPLAPLLHEFTYQAMVQDLLEVQEEAYKYEVDTPKGKIAKQVLLNENDEVWLEFRHQHIAKVLEQLSAKFKDFMETQGAQLAAGKVTDLSQMATATKEIGQYKEMVGKLGQHMNIAQECMNQVEGRQLLEVAQLEQTMATGVNSEGKKTKLAGLTLELEKLLQNANIEQEDKKRLLAIFIISQMQRFQKLFMISDS
jgi:hypothetical protein